MKLYDKRDDTNASPMTTDTSRSLMTETAQLNRHIRCSTKNNFGVIVFHYLNNQYPYSCFTPYVVEMLQITAEQARRQFFVAL